MLTVHLLHHLAIHVIHLVLLLLLLHSILLVHNRLVIIHITTTSSRSRLLGLMRLVIVR